MARQRTSKPKKVSHEHVIRCLGGSPIVAAATLPEGKLLDWWDPPTANGVGGTLDEVEYVIDGRLKARGPYPLLLQQIK